MRGTAFGQTCCKARLVLHAHAQASKAGMMLHTISMQREGQVCAVRAAYSGMTAIITAKC